MGVLTGRPRQRRRAVVWAVSVFGLVLIMVLGVLVGQVHVPVRDVVAVLGARGLGLPSDVSTAMQQIVWDVRAPRALGGMLVGAALAVTGVVIQAVVRNPLGDPYVIGVSPGASLGAVAAIVLGAGLTGFGVAAAAFIGALLAFLAVMWLARRGGGWVPGRVVLAGVAIGYLLMSVTYFLQVLATPTQLQEALFWMLGSVSGIGWSKLPLLLIATCLGFAWILVRARWLDSLASGHALAQSQGIPVARFQFEMMALAALMTASTVAVVGGIGFVGLVIPHAARFLVGAAHRRVLLAGALLGAGFLPLVDIAARTTLAPVELPIGILTAVIGAPLFIAQLVRVDRTVRS